MTAEHAVAVDHIKEETCKDTQHQKQSIRILTEDWEQRRKDPDTPPSASVYNELYAVDCLFTKVNQIIVPTSLQSQIERNVTLAAHHLLHLGMTKIKKMPRLKYWFPNKNSMIGQIIGQC